MRQAEPRLRPRAGREPGEPRKTRRIHSMNGSTPSDQAKTFEERIEQHLEDLSSTASCL